MQLKNQSNLILSKTKLKSSLMLSAFSRIFLKIVYESSYLLNKVRKDFAWGVFCSVKFR